MLSSMSLAQKNLSEEDGSGSDAGSEVGLEPETDRFGFILTNGSTAGSVGPSPELVRQRETKWINIISQWDRMLLKKTSKVKVQCQKGIPASLRAKCWPLLCGATDKMKLNGDLYQSLDSQPALQSWVDVIERDLDRQFPFHEMFLSKDGHGQRGLFRVLKAYTQYQPDEGYCQAQGPVAAVLLMNMPAEEAFWCLVQISEQYLPGYYSPLLEGVLFDAAMLNWVLKRTCPAAHKHLQHHGVEPLMFATDWLMCLFTRHLPFNTLLRVWDLFFCHGVRVLLQVAVVLVRRVLGRAEQRKQCQGQMETLERLRGVREEVQEEDNTFIAEVCSVQLSARDLEKRTEKEFEKWRKDKPSSTFDPRGRCQGYRTVWEQAQQNEEERDRKEREKGNLSVPLARSASTLSLSPSLLHKWRKGSKASMRECEGGGKVVRHLSMGAKEDWRSWTDLNFRKVQDVQEEEDVVFEEHKKQSEMKLKGQTEQKELLEKHKKMEVQNVPTEHKEEMKNEEEQIEKVATRTTERDESHLTEETKVGRKQTKSPVKDQPEGKNIQPTEHKQGEEPEPCIPSEILEQQNHNTKGLEIEIKETAIVKDQIEQVETSVSEKEDSHLKDTEQMEETNAETEQTKRPVNVQTEKNITEPDEQEDEQDSCSPSQVLEQQSHESNNFEIDVKETVIVKDPTEQVETRIYEREDSQQKEETNVETEPTKSPIKDETEENNIQPDEHEPGEELEPCSPSQALEQQNHESKGLEIEVKETVILKDQTEQVETSVTDKEDSKLKETEQMEETNVETEQTKSEHKEEINNDKEQIEKVATRTTERDESHLTEETNEGRKQTKSPVKDQTEENNIQPTEHKQEEELDSCSPSQVQEQQNHESDNLKIEEKAKNEETEKHVAESEAAVEENQTETLKDAKEGHKLEVEMQEDVSPNEEQIIQADMKPEEGTETENVPQVDTAETSLGSETDSKVETPTDKDPSVETETHRQQHEVITETEINSLGDALEGKCQSAESLADSDMREEPHTQTETGTSTLAQTHREVEGNAVTQELEAEIVKTDSEAEAETSFVCSPECIQPKDDAELVSDAKTKAEIVAHVIVTETSEAFEKESDAEAAGAVQESQERSVTAQLEEEDDQTQAEEIPTEAEISEVTPPPSTQSEEVTITDEPDGRTSLEEEPEQQTSQFTPVKEEKVEENVQENTAGEDDVFISTEQTGGPNTDSNPQIQEKAPHPAKDQAVLDNNALTQASGHRSSRSSGDFCVRMPSNSRGSRLARRLSEDLFIMPEKTAQPQSTNNQKEVNHSESNPGALNPTQIPPAEASEKTAVQQEPPPASPPKRFGLFRRLRGEQHKKAPKIQVPKILIQDFSDGTGVGTPVAEEVEEKLSSRERRRRRRERERKEKEEEKLRKKREKEQDRERRKPQTRGKSFQVQKEKGSGDVTEPAKTHRHSVSHAESYF